MQNQKIQDSKTRSLKKTKDDKRKQSYSKEKLSKNRYAARSLKCLDERRPRCMMCEPTSIVQHRISRLVKVSQGLCASPQKGIKMRKEKSARPECQSPCRLSEEKLYESIALQHTGERSRCNSTRSRRSHLLMHLNRSWQVQWAVEAQATQWSKAWQARR